MPSTLNNILFCFIQIEVLRKTIYFPIIFVSKPLSFQCWPCMFKLILFLFFNFYSLSCTLLLNYLLYFRSPSSCNSPSQEPVCRRPICSIETAGIFILPSDFSSEQKKTLENMSSYCVHACWQKHATLFHRLKFNGFHMTSWLLSLYKIEINVVCVYYNY